MPTRAGAGNLGRSADGFVAPMTRMLASVTGVAEAEIALAAGADIIDLKDPSRGALGAVDPAIVRATVAAVAGRCPVSAVTGDLPMDPVAVRQAVEAMAATGADFVKIGIFPAGDFQGGDPIATIAALKPLAGRARLIAVMMADRAPDFSFLPVLASAGFAGAMLDTADKSGGRLLEVISLSRLKAFVEAARAEGLLVGLAGSLEAPDIPRLLVLAPDVLGFRGALCGAPGRAGVIDRHAAAAIRALIPPEAKADGARKIDYTLLAGRGYAPPDPNGDPALYDKVFVHDLVLPVRIGVYAREHDAPQNVRFAVEATIARAARPTQDLRDVFSYDIITDGIRLLIDAGHVGLVETLAERIAGMLLGHSRVVKVAVRLEKLDTGSGVVGVAIERTRQTASAGNSLPVADPAHPVAASLG